MFIFHLNVYPKGMVTEIQFSVLLKARKWFPSFFIIIALLKKCSCQKKEKCLSQEKTKASQRDK